MKVRHVSAVGLLLVCGLWAASAADSESILFVGNSFTAGALSPVQAFRPESVNDLNQSEIGGVPALFKSFSTEAGLDYQVSHELAGGINLDFHYQQKAELIAQHWDHVVLQPYSTLDQEHPGDPTRMIDYAARLTTLLQSANPAVDIRLVATWSRADQVYEPSGHWYGKPIDAMATELRAACDAARRNAPGIHAVIPVGQAWNQAMQTGVALSNPYLQAPPGQINLWASDNYHASVAGYYLEALVVFGSVTGRDPRSLGAHEQAAAQLGLAAGEATALQRIAHQVLSGDGPVDAPSVAPAIGVLDQPCARVPISPTDAHKASADWYGNWMHDWLALDWAQQCRYQAENAALPAANSRRVVYLGDSITEGWKTADPAFFNTDVLDRGVSGQTTSQMLLRLRSDVLELHPQVLHIMAGTNDVAGNTGATSLAHIEDNIASMAELARAHGIRVVLASIPPAASFPWQPAMRPAAHIQALNAWLKAYARREGFVYADYYAALATGDGALPSSFSEDGVHPNAAGYSVMKPIAERSMAEALRRRPK